MAGRVGRRELAGVAGVVGSALHALYVVSGMTVERFAQWALAGRGARTVGRWLANPAAVPEKVEEWAASVEELVEQDGELRMRVGIPPPPRRGRPRRAPAPPP